jgi:hypothetical protein
MGGPGHEAQADATCRPQKGNCHYYHCSHSITLGADHWPDHFRLSDLEPRFVCEASGDGAL